jgi:glutaredoxin
MLIYYGDPSCEPCRETKMLLDQYGIRYDFYNVMNLPEYRERTPMLRLEDGTMLEGKEAIVEWLKIWI